MSETAVFHVIGQMRIALKGHGFYVVIMTLHSPVKKTLHSHRICWVLVIELKQKSFLHVSC